jgi:hypothetical protein
MAYVSQETKAKIVAAVKPILKKYGLKATFAVRNHSTISVNIKSGKIDFIENYIATDANVLHGRKMAQDQIDYIRKNKSLDVNPYWFHEHFSGKAKAALTEIFAAIKKGGSWYDESDIQTDYFNTAFYMDVNVGKWNKPYLVE